VAVFFPRRSHTHSAPLRPDNWTNCLFFLPLVSWCQPAVASHSPANDPKHPALFRPFPGSVALRSNPLFSSSVDEANGGTPHGPQNLFFYAASGQRKICLLPRDSFLRPFCLPNGIYLTSHSIHDFPTPFFPSLFGCCNKIPLTLPSSVLQGPVISHDAFFFASVCPQDPKNFFFFPSLPPDSLTTTSLF